MFIIGIDPGISGAICFFESDIIKDVIEMPVMADGKKNKRQINGPQIVNEIQKRIENIPKKNIFVVVEHVSAMPGQGVTSMFNFGQSFGVIKGVCAAMQLPIYFVRPSKWKKYFNLIKLIKRPVDQKPFRFFPIYLQTIKKKTIIKADAILIASFFNNTFKSETQS